MTPPPGILSQNKISLCLISFPIFTKCKMNFPTGSSCHGPNIHSICPRQAGYRSLGTYRRTITHIHTCGQFKVFSEPNTLVLKCKEEAGVYREKHANSTQEALRQDSNSEPQNCERNVQTAWSTCYLSIKQGEEFRNKNPKRMLRFASIPSQVL